MNIFKQTLLVFICISFFISSAEGKKMSILQKQPVFSVKINTFGVKYILKINGITLLRETSSDGQLTTTLPVNHWMKSGDNTMEVEIRPPAKGALYNPSAKLEFELLINENRTPHAVFSIANILISGSSANDNQTLLSSASGKYDSADNFNPSKNGDVVVSDILVDKIEKYEGGLIFKRNLNVISSLPLWSFFNSDDIPDYDSMSDEDYYKELDTLLKEYLKVQEAIENNTVSNVIDMFDERNSETDTAFYLSPGETKQGIFESLEAVANDDGIELLPLTRKKVIFTIEKNRKLVRLSRKGVKAAIALNFKDGSGSQRYEMYFRIEDGKWILTR